MTLIHIDRLQPAMKLATDVKDRNGRLLANQGTELNDQHLLAFRTWGIKEVNVMEPESEQNSVPGSDSELDMCRHQVEEQIEKLKPFFRLCDLEHPFIRELMRLSALKGLNR